MLPSITVLHNKVISQTYVLYKENVVKTNHIHLNDSRSVRDDDVPLTLDFVTKDYIQSPEADRHEAAHYVHDHALSTKNLEDWL